MTHASGPSRVVMPDTPIISAQQLHMANSVAEFEGWKHVGGEELRQTLLYVHSITGFPGSFPITIWEIRAQGIVRCTVDTIDGRRIIDIQEVVFSELPRTPCMVDVEYG